MLAVMVPESVRTSYLVLAAFNADAIEHAPHRVDSKQGLPHPRFRDMDAQSPPQKANHHGSPGAAVMYPELPDSGVKVVVTDQ